MAKEIFQYNDMLDAQRTNLAAAERNVELVRGPASGLMDYEVRDFFPYATPQDLKRILHDMERREIAHNIKAVENALTFMRLTSELVDAQQAYRHEIGSIISPKYIASLGNDEEALMSLFEKTSMAVDDLRPHISGKQETRIKTAIDNHMQSYYRAESDQAPLSYSGLPAEFLVQKIHDLRAACGELLMRDTALKLTMLHNEIDFVAVQKKVIDENIVSPSPEREEQIESYLGHVMAHTIIVDQNITTARDFFNTLSSANAYDPAKNNFVASRHIPLSIRPLMYNMP